MLEQLLLKHLTKKGKIAYFVGTFSLFALLAFVILGVAGYSMEEGRSIFFIGMIITNIVWAGICFMFWKKPTNEDE